VPSHERGPHDTGLDAFLMPAGTFLTRRDRSRRRSCGCTRTGGRSMTDFRWLLLALLSFAALRLLVRMCERLR
jgi:hypothetical protein